MALFGFEMALFGFKWVCFLSSKTAFHIGKVRGLSRFLNGFVSQNRVFANTGSAGHLRACQWLTPDLCRSPSGILISLFFLSSPHPALPAWTKAV